MIRLPLYPETYKLPIETLSGEARNAECERCPTLSMTVRTVCMSSDGEPGGVLFLSDAPSAEDDKAKKPLSGTLRRKLKELLAEANYEGPVAYDVAFRCNPPEAVVKKELKTWVDNCKPYLAKSLRDLAPKRIVCLGAVAASALLGRAIDTYSSRRGVAWIGDIAVFWVPPFKRTLENRFFALRFDADVEWALRVDLATLPRPPREGVCQVIESIADAETAAVALRKAGGFTLDVETAGQMFDTFFKVLCTSTTPRGTDDAWVWTDAALQSPWIFALFKELLESTEVEKTGQNGKYDVKAIRCAYGIVTARYTDDSHLMRRSLYSDAKADLNTIGELVGMGGHKQELKAVLLKERGKINTMRRKVKEGKIDIESITDPLMRRAVELTKLKADAFAYGLVARTAPEVLWRYNALDTISTERAIRKCALEVAAAVHPGRKEKDLGAHYQRLITRLTPTIAQIEHWGMPVDRAKVAAADAVVAAKLEEARERLLAFKPGLNPRSTLQLVDFIFRELGLPPQKSFKVRKTDAPACDAHVLKALKGHHPFIPALLDFRKLDKLRGTYTLGLQQFMTPDNRVHATLNPGGTKTGRLSSQDPNCFDGETEVLTPAGWVRFDQYIPGTPVMQWHPDNTMDFVEPTGYVKMEDREVLHITTRAIDLCVTPDHRCLLFNRQGQPRTMLAREWRWDYAQRHAGRFVWPSTLRLSKAQIGLICAVQADGRVDRKTKSSTPGVSFGFRKWRKVERLAGILGELGLPNVPKQYADGYWNFALTQAEAAWLWNFLDPQRKHFGAWLLQLDQQGAEWFADEVFYWDGLSTRKTNYSSSEIVNSSWVQTVMVLLNKRAKLRSYLPPSGTPNWQVDVCHGRDTSMTTNSVVSAGRSDVYCVSVPSDAILVRRNGRCAVTHQCQNLGSGKEDADKALGKMIKDIFTAAPGNVLLQLDYSQLELRVAALLCEDLKMLEVFVSGQDYHWATARLVAPVAWGLKPEEVTKAHRSMVKAVVFGLLYGMTDAGLAMRLGIKVEQAAALRTAIFGGFPKLYSWYQRMHRYAAEFGMCLTYWKGQPARRRPLLDIADCTGRSRWDGSEELTAGKRKAINASINTPVQGTASDFMLMSLCDITDAILANNWPAKVIMSVHDSAVIEVREDFALEMARFAKKTMESQGWGSVPIVVDVEKGYAWGSMEKWDLQ